MITIGTQLDALIEGHHVRCRVAAIRHSPFSYVELEPLDGGARRPLPMHIAERMPVAGDADVATATAHVLAEMAADAAREVR